MESEPYTLVVPFDRDDPEFARGVEVGMLYERLRREPPPVAAVVHASNAEMAMRLGEALDLAVSAEDLDDDWLAVSYR